MTPKGSSVTWKANTTGHQSTFTVLNTGSCSDTYTFTAAGSNGITGITLSQTSAPVDSGGSTTVTATYNVTVPTTPGSATLRLTASGLASDSGSYTITIVGLAITPKSQADAATMTLSQAVTFQVQNIGTDTSTVSLTCVVSGSETCGTVKIGRAHV